MYTKLPNYPSHAENCYNITVKMGIELMIYNTKNTFIYHLIYY